MNKHIEEKVDELDAELTEHEMSGNAWFMNMSKKEALNWLRTVLTIYAAKEREELRENVQFEVAGLAALVQQIPDTGQAHIAGMKLGNILALLTTEPPTSPKEK